MLHLTNPCTKRKALILNKPKGKIYKTKSLRHYITFHIKEKKGFVLYPISMGVRENTSQVTSIAFINWLVLTACQLVLDYLMPRC